MYVSSFATNYVYTYVINFSYVNEGKGVPFFVGLFCSEYNTNPLPPGQFAKHGIFKGLKLSIE